MPKLKRETRKEVPDVQDSKPGKQQSGKCDSKQDAMLIGQALTAKSGFRREWLVDSGATSHMSNDRRLFTQVRHLDPVETVTLGDERNLEVKTVGTEELEMLLPDGSSKRCSLQKVPITWSVS